MKIEVWVDFVCPFCYLGKRYLEIALEQFPNLNNVEIEYMSFELDPNQPLYAGKSIYQSLSDKYGMSIEEAIEANKHIGKQASKVGLNYNIDEMKPTNTLDAHRLVKYAKSVGKDKQLTEKIFYSYFTDSKLISDLDTLGVIGESVGLDKDILMDVLNDKSRYQNEVREDEALATQYKVTGVPFILINQKYAISGAQPIEVFQEVLQKALKEEMLG